MNTNNSSIDGSSNSTDTFKRYLKFHITFKKMSDETPITEFQDISINSIRFKISKIDYVEENYDTTKEYLFEKVQVIVNEEIYYYASNNDYDYDPGPESSDDYQYMSKTDAIVINEIIINDKYKFIGFNINHPPDLHGNIEIYSESKNNDQIISKTYLINIEIILNENTTIIKLNNNNKYTKLLKLLKKHLNSRNTNVKTLYHDLLNKIQQENTLIITTSSIININSLLKLLSEYLGINSKNPNILYRSLLTKK